jgi:16S rRNA processing protein RimM
MSGIVSKEEADAKRGTKLFVPRSRLPDLPDDEYYYSDLEGLDVFDTGGAPLGQVKSVHNHGASDLLEIKRPNSNATVLLPFTNAAVPTVDLKLGRIVADPPLGIFPEQE